MLPFKKGHEPRQTFVEIGDKKIGVLELKAYFCLTPNEDSYINEHLASTRSRDRIYVEFAQQIHQKRAIEGETIQAISNALASPEAMGIPGLPEWIEINMREENEQFNEDLTRNNDTFVAAYAGAIISERLKVEDWQFEFGFSDCQERPQEVTMPLLIELANFAVNEKRGNRLKDKESNKTTEFEGFSIETVKKSSPASVPEAEKELTGAASTG